MALTTAQVTQNSPSPQSSSTPSYSVIVPVYNGEHTIEQTLRSALAQTLPPLEILVLEDGSNDTTPSILQRLQKEFPSIQLHPNPENLGVARTRNRGLAMAKGTYIAFLDADDVWEPSKMEQQLVLMEKNDCDFSYTGYYFLDSQGRPTGASYSVPKTLTFSHMLKENVVGCATVVLRTTLATKYRFSPDYAHEDYVLWMELLRDGHSACGIDKPLMGYRLSPDSRSGNKRKAAKGRWDIYRKALGLSVWQASRAFVSYAWRGLKKHKFS